MKYSREVEEILGQMVIFARDKKHEYITPEHLLYSITFNNNFIEAFKVCNGDLDKLRKNIEKYLDENIETLEKGDPEISYGLNLVLSNANLQATSSQRSEITLTHVVNEIMNLEDSYAVYYILEQNIDPVSYTHLVSRGR